MHSNSSALPRISMDEALLKLRTEWIPAGSAVVLQGPPGIAKTEMVKDFCTAVSRKVADFGFCFGNHAAFDETFLTGLPLLGSTMLTGAGQVTDPRTQYAVAAWLQADAGDDPRLGWGQDNPGWRGAFPALCPQGLRATPDSEQPLPKSLQDAYDTAEQQIITRQLVRYSTGVSVIDEAFQVTRDRMPPLAQYASEGRVGTYGVPRRRWARIMITNRLQDQSIVEQPPANLDNRVAKYEVYIEAHTVCRYWRRKGQLRPELIDYCYADPNTVLEHAVPVDGRQFSTARSWETAGIEISKYLANNLKLPKDQPIPIDDREVRRILLARCGEAAAGGYFDYIKTYKDLPTYEEVVADWEKARRVKNPLGQITIADRLAQQLDINDEDAAKAVCRYILQEGKIIAGGFATSLIEKHQFAGFRSHALMELIRHCGDAVKTRIFGSTDL